MKNDNVFSKGERIERDDNVLDMLSKGYLGIIITIAPGVIMFLFICYRFIFENLSKQFPEIRIFLLIIALATFTSVTYFIFYLLYKKFSSVPSKELCRECIQTNILDLLFMQYDLVTSTRLEKIEREIDRGDEVLVYTCSLDTEPYNVVRYNVKKKKIKYDILYYEGSFHSRDKLLYRTTTKLDISEIGFDSRLAHSNTNKTGCGFDLFIVKRGKLNKRYDRIFDGYYAVNYSTNSTDCQHKASGRCPEKLQCDPTNEKLFYRRMDEPLTESIYKQLIRITTRSSHYPV